MRDTAGTKGHSNGRVKDHVKVNVTANATILMSTLKSTLKATLTSALHSTHQSYIFSKKGMPTRSNAFFMTCRTISHKETLALTRDGELAFRI